MGTLPPSELLRLWKLEKLTVEMAIGQILQHMDEIYGMAEELHRLRREVRRLKAKSPQPSQAGEVEANGEDDGSEQAVDSETLPED